MVKIDRTKTVAENVIEIFKKLEHNRRELKEWESGLLALAKEEVRMTQETHGCDACGGSDMFACNCYE